MLERVLGRHFQIAKSLRVHDHANAHARRRQWDHPEPAIEAAHHANERSVDSRVAIDILVVREDGKLLQVVIGLLQLEEISNDCLPTAAIEQITRAYFLGEGFLPGEPQGGRGLVRIGSW